jgi:hypothetical protein
MIVLVLFGFAFVGGVSYIVGTHLGYDRGYFDAQNDAAVRAAKERRDI